MSAFDDATGGIRRSILMNLKRSCMPGPSQRVRKFGGDRFRGTFWLLVAAASLPGCSPAASPPRTLSTPSSASDGPSTWEVQAHVEADLERAFGAKAVEVARSAPTSVMLAWHHGSFNRTEPRIRMAVKEASGWRLWADDRAEPRRIEHSRAMRIEAYLKRDLLWEEVPFHPAMDCPDSGAIMMVIRHRGKVRVARQSCGPALLTGELAVLVSRS